MAEKFILRTSLTSPFGRKARMAVEVLGLADRVQVMPADPSDANDSLRRQNPLGKVPCLVREDGSAIYDSGVIVEFLQWVAGTDRLLPAQGPERFPMFTQARLIDGALDAAVLMIYEERFRPPEMRSASWVDYQRGKLMRGLAAFEAAPPDPARTTVVTITLAVVLEFLGRRMQMNWQPDFPRLAAWLQDYAAREPAFARTAPPPA